MAAIAQPQDDQNYNFYDHVPYYNDSFLGAVNPWRSLKKAPYRPQFSELSNMATIRIKNTVAAQSTKLLQRYHLIFTPLITLLFNSNFYSNFS